MKKLFLLLTLIPFLNLVAQLQDEYVLSLEDFRWRSDNGTELTATWLAPEGEAITINNYDNIRLRFEVNDLYIPYLNYTPSEYIKLQYSSDQSTWIDISTSETNSFQLVLSDYFNDGDPTTNQIYEGADPFKGGIMTESRLSIGVPSGSSGGLEYEYCIKPSSNALSGTYYFRTHFDGSCIYDKLASAKLASRIISHAPTSNALDVLANSDISVTFNGNIDGTTLDDDITFNVDGTISGEHQGAFSGGGTSTITFNPTNDFEVGEVVTVTLTTGIKSTDGTAISNDYTFQFVVESPYGNGQFSSGGSVSGYNTRGISLGDLDGDDDLDAFLATSSGNRAWLNDGSGSFTDSGQDLGSSDSKEICIGDLDGDGDLDVFVANYGQANKIWLNDGNGDFTDSGQNLGTSNSIGISLGDLDGDGDLDIFVGNYSQGNKVWLNNGSGSFYDNGNSLGTSNSKGCSIGDLDGDGDLDAFVANYGQANKVWLNDGSGNFTDSGQNIGTSNSLGVSIGDLDGDGDLDAFEIVYSDLPNKVWLNNGDGVFIDSGQSLGSSRSHYVSLGDLDADCDLDAFVTNLDEQPNKVWINNGNAVFSNSGQSLGSSFSACVSLGDLDGDNDLDAFVSNAPNQASIVWLNQGVTPVELTSFHGSVSNGQVILIWQTATEVNNFGFDIQKSEISSQTSENEWETIGFVDGHGNSNSPKDYSYTDKPTDGSKFQYRLKQIDIDGGFEYFPNAFGIEVELELPTEYKLAQNYPNPFNPSTAIQYSIPAVKTPLLGGVGGGFVTLKIYDILGREVATLVSKQQNPGNYEVVFNASNLVSGMYIYQLSAGDYKAVKKLLLMK
jgi:hypothetical protein